MVSLKALIGLAQSCRSREKKQAPGGRGGFARIPAARLAVSLPIQDYRAALTLLGYDKRMMDEAPGMARQRVDGFWPEIGRVADVIEARGDGLDGGDLQRTEDEVCEPSICELDLPCPGQALQS